MPGCEKKLDVRSSSLMMTSPLPLGLWSMPFVSEGWLFTFVLGSNPCTLLSPAPAAFQERENREKDKTRVRTRWRMERKSGFIYAHDVQAKSNKTQRVRQRVRVWLMLLLFSFCVFYVFCGYSIKLIRVSILALLSRCMASGCVWGVCVC